MKPDMFLDSLTSFMGFKFHYVQMKQYIANLIVEAKIKFKFHYVQMKLSRLLY